MRLLPYALILLALAFTLSTIIYAASTTVSALSPATTQICNDTSGYSVTYNSLNATFSLGPNANTCFNITVSNATSEYLASNRSIITAINYTSSNKTVYSSITIHYACSMPPQDITPFALRNGTWKEINPFTINVAACTAMFAIPSDSVIALINTNTNSTPVATIATVATTTVSGNPGGFQAVNANTTVQNTAPASTQYMGSYALAITLAIVIIVAIAILFIYIKNRK